MKPPPSAPEAGAARPAGRRKRTAERPRSTGKKKPEAGRMTNSTRGVGRERRGRTPNAKDNRKRRAAAPASSDGY